MTHKFTYDKAAIVNTKTKWLPINEHTPIGVRMQLIEKAQGVAYTRTHHKGDGFTHWQSLPTFEETQQ